MVKKIVVSCMCAYLIAGSSFAGTMGPINKPFAAASWFGTFSAGPIWEQAGKTQLFQFTPDIEKAYVANNTSHALFNGEVFAGMQKSVSSVLQAQFGLAVAATSNAPMSGIIWDDADPQFDNYVCKYSIQHTHLAIKGKALADMDYWVIPWVSASIGVGFNKSHAFNNTPTIFEAVSTANFNSHTQTTYSYTVGAGIQKALDSHWQVGVGYEFSDWGKSVLGQAYGQTLNTHLGLNHLYTNGVLFNMTYLA